eukprot:TRINITY_DN2653_c0_g1_i8.p2 TRINITY_DN2653_c0_g1~~TRINITY_DN2653_c0_g1_i8.p2  ORF type:complete len:231 (-),score=7.19 TRINITY_DN2653_c0_g1_i8:356-1048(-)
MGYNEESVITRYVITRFDCKNSFDYWVLLCIVDIDIYFQKQYRIYRYKQLFQRPGLAIHCIISTTGFSYPLQTQIYLVLETTQNQSILVIISTTGFRYPLQTQKFSSRNILFFNVCKDGYKSEINAWIQKKQEEKISRLCQLKQWVLYGWIMLVIFFFSQIQMKNNHTQVLLIFRFLVTFLVQLGGSYGKYVFGYLDLREKELFLATQIYVEKNCFQIILSFSFWLVNIR